MEPHKYGRRVGILLALGISIFLPSVLGFSLCVVFVVTTDKELRNPVEFSQVKLFILLGLIIVEFLLSSLSIIWVCFVYSREAWRNNRKLMFLGIIHGLNCITCLIILFKIRFETWWSFLYVTISVFSIIGILISFTVPKDESIGKFGSGELNSHGDYQKINPDDTSSDELKGV